MFMASIAVIFSLRLLLGKPAHFESSAQLCLLRRKTERFLLGEPHSGHIRAAVTAAKLFCWFVANSAGGSGGDHPALKKNKRRERKTKPTPKALSVFNFDFAEKSKKKKAMSSLRPGMG